MLLCIISDCWRHHKTIVVCMPLVKLFVLYHHIKSCSSHSYNSYLSKYNDLRSNLRAIFLDHTNSFYLFSQQAIQYIDTILKDTILAFPNQLTSRDFVSISINSCWFKKKHWKQKYLSTGKASDDETWRNWRYIVQYKDVPCYMYILTEIRWQIPM